MGLELMGPLMGLALMGPLYLVCFLTELPVGHSR